MPILENAKEYIQRATGLRRRGRKAAPELARARNLTLSASKMTVSSPITRDGRSSSTEALSISAKGTTRRP